MGAGGGSFHPGSLGGGGSFGSIQGASGGGYHAVSKPVEKPLKVCMVPGDRKLLNGMGLVTRKPVFGVSDQI